MRARTLRGVGDQMTRGWRACLGPILLPILIVGLAQPAGATVRQEPRRVTGVWDDTDIVHVVGTVSSKHDVKRCYSHVPVELWRKVDDVPTRVAAGDTNGDGDYSIEAEPEPGPYRIVAPRVVIRSGGGDDRVACEKAVVAGNYTVP